MSKAGIALGSALLIVTGCQTQAANPQPDPEPAGERLQLRTDGIGLVDFGDPFEESARILRDRWGPELSSEERICDSGASLQILFWDGVMLVYYPEGLAGYLVGPPTDTPATQAAKDINTARTLGGLEVGDAIRTARDIYGDQFVLDESSLGPEWYVADETADSLLAGFASGLSDAAIVTQVYSGDICAVR
jgi:hypothetical protein